MIQQVLLPRLGETMDEAEIAQWLKAVGDPVEKGEVLLEITTDKATLEVESTASGTLRQVLADAGRMVPVNGVIALIGDPNEALPKVEVTYPLAGEKAAGRSGAERSAVSSQRSAAAPANPQSAIRNPQLEGPRGISPRARRAAKEQDVPLDLIAGTGPGGRVIERDVLAYAGQVKDLEVSPVARRLAAARGIHLPTVTGTGPRGRITKTDVETLAVNPQSATRSSEAPVGVRNPQCAVPLTPMRRIVAERMSRAKREIPHYYLMVDVDMTEASARRAAVNAAGEVKVTVNDLVLRAAALAARDVPEALGQWSEGGVIPLGRVNLGLAVALEQGLIVPVVRDADRLDLPALARATAALVEKARSKRLLPEEMEGGCLTVTNLGMFGIDRFLPIIVPGESAILGVGRMGPAPVVVDGGLAVRLMMAVSLAADHRVADGAVGARFLAAVKAHLERPGDA